MTSVKKMRTTLLVGIIVAVAVFFAVAVTSFHESQDDKEELMPPLPQILIFPEPPLIEPPENLPDVNPSNYHNIA